MCTICRVFSNVCHKAESDGIIIEIFRSIISKKYFELIRTVKYGTGTVHKIFFKYLGRLYPIHSVKYDTVPYAKPQFKKRIFSTAFKNKNFDSWILKIENLNRQEKYCLICTGTYVRTNHLWYTQLHTDLLTYFHLLFQDVAKWLAQREYFEWNYELIYNERLIIYYSR